MTIERVPDRAYRIGKTCQRVQDFLKSSGALWSWSGHAHVAELASGRLSNFYADCSPLFTNPTLQDAAGEALSLLADLVNDGNFWIVAVSTGASGLAQSIARASGLSPAYIEPGEKLGLRRFDLGTKPSVWLCDDVATTGGTIVRARKAILEAHPDAVLCDPSLVLVDRRELERLPKDRAEMKIISLVRPMARTYVNDRALPGAMKNCKALKPKGNWKKLNEEMLPDA
ncbi:hypothetical protein LCGC14_2476010 [marine sediment metagenome]|uniref:Phosphoribosyltransferase domain-containing protein n=1 Tax=marine sediment metagenome TaxID=412755 RepID=A0A0F9B9R9_9ZZZZ